MKILGIIPLAIGTFAIGTDNFIAAGILGSMSRGLGISLAVAGLQVTVFSLVYALSSPLLSAFTQRFGRRVMLLGSMTLFAVANVLTAISPNYEILLSTRILAAVAAGIFGPMATAAAVEQFEPTYQGRAIAIVTGGLTVSMVFGVPLGVFISDLSDWRGAFWFVAALAVMAGISIGIYVPRMPGTAGPGIAERFRPALRPAVALTLIQSTVVVGSTFIVFTYLGSLADQIAAGAHGGVNITTLMLIFGVGAVLGNTIGGRSADRLGGTATIQRAVVVLIVALATISLVAWILSGPTGLLALAVVVAIWGVSGWAFTPAQFSRLAEIGPEHMRFTFALNNSAIYLGSALGASVGGLLVAGVGIRTLGWVAAVGELMGLGLIWLSIVYPTLGTPVAPKAAEHTGQMIVGQSAGEA